MAQYSTFIDVSRKALDFIIEVVYNIRVTN